MRTPGSLSHLLYPLKKRWYIVVICIAISLVLASRYLYISTPQYQSSATIKIDDSQGESNGNIYQDFDVLKTNVKIQTEVEVLKSRSLFEHALDRLDFFVEYYKEDDLKTEEIYHNSPITVDFKISDNTFSKSTYSFKYKGGDNFTITSETNGVLHEKNGVFGNSICDDGICLTINKNENGSKNKLSNDLNKNWSFIVYSKEALTTKLLNKDYIVKTVDKDANIIKVYYTHAIPEKSSRMVNAIAEAYIEQNIIEKHEFAGKTIDFINSQLANVVNELSSARDSIKNYRINHNIVNINQETDATYKTLSQLEIQKIDLNLKLVALENLSDYLRHNREIKYLGPELESIQDGLFSEAVNRLNTKLRERSEVSKKYTAESNEIKNIDEDITQQKAYLIESVNNTRRKLLARQDELFLAIDDEKATFNDVAEKESSLQELNRNYFLFEKVYNFLIEKRTEALITSQLNVSFNKILESAIIPTEAIFPRKNVVMGIALFIGLLLGIVLAYLRNSLKPEVNVPEDMSLNSSIGVIGHIEKIHQGKPAYKNFTALATRIMMNRQESDSFVITVTSTRKGEGKSFIAAQLARTLVAQDKKVIIIDLNTYSPKMDEWFDIRNDEGIKEVYTYKKSLQDVIRITSIPHLDVITCGMDEQPISHLIGTIKTKEILAELKLHYDTIIIDAPDVGEYTDPIPYMKWSDLNLYVVKADSGRNDLIANAEMVKEEYRLQEVFFVINAMSEKRNHTGYISLGKTKSIKSKIKIPQLTNLFML